MNERIKKHAECIASMSIDYLSGDYDEKLYIDMIQLNAEVMLEIKAKELKKKE